MAWWSKKKPGSSATSTSEAVAETPAAAPAPAPAAKSGPTPDEAMALLREGNQAFLRGENNLGYVNVSDLDELQSGQNPIATIVGCADSRTPPTILFNQGFGRLFSIRWRATPWTVGVWPRSSMR